MTQKNTPMTFETFKRGINTQALVVYDRDVISNITTVQASDSLVFDSRFESGNLKLAQRVLHETCHQPIINQHQETPSDEVLKAFREAPHEYDLILACDEGSMAHAQWYFFSVRNTCKLTCRFNIINFGPIENVNDFTSQPIVLSTVSILFT